MGPIGILLRQCHHKAAAIDNQFNVVFADWPDLNILLCPYQELKPYKSRMATIARTLARCDERKSTLQLTGIDHLATNAAQKKCLVTTSACYVSYSKVSHTMLR